MSGGDFFLIMLATALATLIVLPLTNWALAQLGVKVTS